MGERASILLARKGIEVACGLITFAILARTLTKEQFAIYSLVFGVVAILRLTALPGLGTAVSQAFSRNLPGDFRRLGKLSFRGSFCGSILLLSFAWWYFYTDRVVTGQVLLVVAVCFPLVAGLTFWKAAAAGAERYKRLLFFDGFASVLKCVAVIFCAYYFQGQLLAVLLAAFVVPALINVVATMDHLRKEDSDAKGEPGCIEYGVWITIYQLPTVLSQQLDKFALFYFISPEALAVYAVSLRIPELARTVVGETNATLGPVFARERNYTKSLHHFSLKLWLLYGVISIIGALTVVPFILPILAGENYRAAIPYAQVMTVGVALGYLGDIQFRYIKSHLHGRSFLTITITKAIFDCILILGLGYYFGLVGVVGAYALKNLGYTLITNVVIRFRYLNV